MESTYVWIMYGLLVWKNCMELMFGSVLSCFKLDLWFCFENGVFWLKELQ